MGSFDPINTQQSAKEIILFDGVCNLCNGAVNFILDHDPEKQFLFASLQSEKAKELLAEHPFDPSSLKSIVVLTENGKVLTRSTAALHIAGKLSGAWKMLSFFRFIPAFIRDAIYDVIARYRYDLFGKKDQCRLPTAELRQRFLDAY